MLLFNIFSYTAVYRLTMLITLLVLRYVSFRLNHPKQRILLLFISVVIFYELCLLDNPLYFLTIIPLVIVLLGLLILLVCCCCCYFKKLKKAKGDPKVRFVLNLEHYPTGDTYGKRT